MYRSGKSGAVPRRKPGSMRSAAPHGPRLSPGNGYVSKRDDCRQICSSPFRSCRACRSTAFFPAASKERTALRLPCRYSGQASTSSGPAPAKAGDKRFGFDALRPDGMERARHPRATKPRGNPKPSRLSVSARRLSTASWRGPASACRRRGCCPPTPPSSSHRPATACRRRSGSGRPRRRPRAFRH